MKSPQSASPMKGHVFEFETAVKVARGQFPGLPPGGTLTMVSSTIVFKNGTRTDIDVAYKWPDGTIEMIQCKAYQNAETITQREMDEWADKVRKYAEKEGINPSKLRLRLVSTGQPTEEVLKAWREKVAAIRGIDDPETIPYDEIRSIVNDFVWDY